jgi:class 3 adenylate cyclase/esterase/lipase
MEGGSQTRYARSGDLSIAYQLFGKGPIDLVFVPGFVSHVELNWEMPPYAGMPQALARFARVVMFDKRGTGLSDRDLGAGTLEERMDDVRAVLDAAGMERAALFGLSEGGPMAILFAATYPERVSSLVLGGTFARIARAADYPYGLEAEAGAKLVRQIERSWGTGWTWAFLTQHGTPEDEQRIGARFERLTSTPRVAAELMRCNLEIDVRPALALVRAPTLILHAAGDPAVSVQHGRYLAAHLPGSRYVELPADFHGTVRPERYAPLIAEIEEFLTGQRPVPEEDVERVLATVLFTDIVDSTALAARLGDRRWRELLDSHDAAVRQRLARFRGREVKTVGDGVLATFDGPARAVRCARAIIEAVRPLGLEVRAGVHTGEVELRGEDIGGIAVHIGARVAERAGPGEVLASGTVKDLVAGSGIRFADRGTHALKGVPEACRLYLVEA